MRIWRSVALLLFCATSPVANAATFPERPIRMVVGFAAGSSVDVVARLVGEKLSTQLGQPVIVENIPGAGGNIAAGMVARANKDGYTLLVSNTGYAIAPAIYTKLNFDPAKDLVGVAQFTSMPHVLVSPVNLPASSIAELIALAKAEPGKYNLGSAGIGNADHFAGELLQSMAQIKLAHIPYKGGAQVMTDVINGNIAVFFSGLPGALPMLQTGKVKALGVGTAQRSWALPDVPAIAETLPGYDVSLWYGLMAPAGTPEPVIDKLSTAVAAVLEQPDVKQSLHQIGVDPAPPGAAHFQALINSEMKRWGDVAREAGVKLD